MFAFTFYILGKRRITNRIEEDLFYLVNIAKKETLFYIQLLFSYILYLSYQNINIIHISKLNYKL